MTTEECIQQVCSLVAEEGDPHLVMAPLATLPQGIPSEWREIVGARDPIRSALDVLWTPKRDLLPETVGELERRLRGIGLLSTRQTPFSLVYLFENRGQPSFRRGYPRRLIEREESTRLPTDFLELYQIHDGWTDPYGFTGPLPSEEWFDLTYLFDEDLPDLISGLRLEDFLIVGISSGSEYLGFDISKEPARGMVVSMIEPIELAPDVVRKLDEWMAVDLRYLAG